jgi:internalin A
MPTLQSDQEIVTVLTEKIGAAPTALTYDDDNKLIKLGLSGLALTQLPPELWQLINLQELNLDNNHLSQLPPEIGQLTNLQKLCLNENKLSQLPPEVGQLTSLHELHLYRNQLSQLPPELWLLSKLQELHLDYNQLSQVSSEIGQLSSLHVLRLDANQLSQVPPEIGQLSNLQDLRLDHNQLSQLPHELWRLSNLQELDLDHNLLNRVPPEIGQLTNLQELLLNKNELNHLPPELWRLTGLQRLNLEKNQLSQLPPEIGLLTNLQELWLFHNQLSQLPPEIGLLTNLQRLDLGNNQLCQLPPEIGLLTKLQELWLNDNQLSQLPPDLWQLTNLQRLDLGNNQLSQLPPEIKQLISLKILFIHRNQLSQLPPEIGQLTNLRELVLVDNQLRQLPTELWQLASLQELDFDNNQLSQLPPEIGQLTNLRWLGWINNHLSLLPSKIGQLSNLQGLDLADNQLSQLPPEIGQLTNLQALHLDNNRLSQLPSEVWHLTNLQKLYLSDNQLDEISPEIGQLNNLKELFLSSTRLKRLPTEIGQLTGLQTLNVADIPTLQTPPPEIVARGTADILAFLRELQESSTIRYESKLLLVGEGGTGKSSLLRALRNDTFDANLTTTHGIEVDRLQLLSPHHEIMLNTWDFGGQQIYHATHQFFLTKRSLYMVVWNARLGVEQGRLDYWLETIKAHAPDAPVLLVVTHVDERMPDLNYQLYKDVYPQIAGHLGVSNKNGQGIAELKAMLVEQAVRLPLMGQPWPGRWLSAENVVLARPEHHIDADTYTHCCLTCEVEADIAKGPLGNYLHDLGKILYFRDDYVLSNLIVLKPNWVTRAISRVLVDEATSKRQGILLHSDLPRIWAVDEDGQPYESYLYPVFLRLMERFYLSYQIEADAPGDHSTSSLIPQLLPYQPPAGLPAWPKSPPAGQTQVEMVYRFDFLPPGIMSWFIVRTHRFSQDLHWREGVLLAYEGHKARVELNPMQRELRLLVQGPLPQNFFTILMNTMDVILSRFEGLKVRREIPCNCHWQREETESCPHFYRYEELVRRIEAKRYKVECPESFNEVSVPALLYGIHISTDQQVMEDIQQGQREIRQRLKELEKLDVILGKVNQQSELIARNFTRQWNLEMKKMEAECPNTFFLMSGENKTFDPKNWVSRDYRLYLVCQHPPGPHGVRDSYHLRKSKEWWTTVGPWLNHTLNFLKFAVPMGKAVGVVVEAVDILPDIKQMQANFDLLEQITQALPEFASYDSIKDVNEQTQTDQYQRAVGPALRALHTFLVEADPGQIWGGLYKIPTPDGNILWLCDKHRQQYIARPLKLEA